MQLGRHLRELWSLRAGVAAGFLLALLVALWTVFHIGLFPPKLESRALEMGSASTRVLVDTPKSLVLDLSVQTTDMEAITNRALLVSNVMTSAPVREYIARRAGVPAARLKVASPVTRQWPRPLAQSGEEKRTSDIFNSPDEYRLSLRVNPTVPVIDVFAQAPTAEGAEQLANGAVTGMRDYLGVLGAEQGIPDRQRVTLEQLGRAKGGVINDGVGVTVALISFLLVFAVSCAAVLLMSRVRRGWRAQGAIERERALAPAPAPAVHHVTDEPPDSDDGRSWADEEEEAEEAVDDVRSNAQLTRATAEGLRWITYTRVAVEIVLLGSMVLLARLIPPEAFGVFAIVVIVQELAFTMPAEGIGGALVQLRATRRRHLQVGVMLGIVLGVVLAALGFLAVELIARPVYGDETANLLLLALPCFLLGGLNAVPVAQLRRRLDFARLSIIELAATFTRMSVTIALALSGLDATALVIGHLAATVVALVLAVCFAPVPLPRWNREAFRDLLPYGGPATLATVAWTGFRNGDYAVIGARLGAAQTGYFWRAYQLAVEYQRKISSVMSQMAFPVLARTAGEDEMLALRRRMVQVLTTVLFPLLVTLALLAPVLVPWLFGPAWEPAVLPTQILALGGAATLVIDAVGPALMASGRTKALLGYGVAHFVVYIGAVILVSSGGLAALAIAASVVHTIFLVVAYQVMLGGRVTRALRSLWQDVHAAAISCVALAAAGGAVELAISGAGLPAVVHMALVASAGGLAYLAALRAGFPDAWRDLGAVMRRVIPARVLVLAQNVSLRALVLAERVTEALSTLVRRVSGSVWRLAKRVSIAVWVQAGRAAVRIARLAKGGVVRGAELARRLPGRIAALAQLVVRGASALGVRSFAAGGRLGRSVADAVTRLARAVARGAARLVERASSGAAAAAGRLSRRRELPPPSGSPSSPAPSGPEPPDDAAVGEPEAEQEAEPVGRR